MSTADRLEKIMELEKSLRDQYQEKLEAKETEIERLVASQAELQATIDKQLDSLKDLSVKATANDHVEQQNRELTNRSAKQQAELSELKKRVKSLQRDLAEVRAENKALTRYDPVRMKKNLDANKKKLAEETRANDILQKSLNKTKRENAELQRRVDELEARLAADGPSDDKQEDKEAA